MNQFIIALLCVIPIGATLIDLNNNGYYWRDWNENDAAPVDAVYGGIDHEGRSTFIIKTVYPTDVTPILHDKTWFEFTNVHKVSHGEVQILCSFSQHRLKWIPTKAYIHINKVRKFGNMIRGGFDELRPVYIGRKVYGAESNVGNAIVSHITHKISVLRVTKNGFTVEEKDNFEILVYDGSTEDCQKVNIILPEKNL